MEHDIYDSLRLTATTCEKIEEMLPLWGLYPIYHRGEH